jgi:hypothetical protein
VQARKPPSVVCGSPAGRTAPCYALGVDPRLEQIVELAFRSVPAADANSAIGAVRRGSGKDPKDGEGGGGGETPARAYELVLPPAATFDSFLRDQVPKLVYHLESIGAHPPQAAGVVICLFAGDQLHFIHAGKLLETLCRLLEIAPVELVRRFGTGERRTAMPAALAALPPPPLPNGED